MARHAGFGSVATITEELVNVVAATYVKNSFGPRFFPLPQTLNVGSTVVTFGGIMEMLAPKIEFHANPADLVKVHFSFRSTLRAQFSGQPMRTWTVQLDGTVDLGLITTIPSDKIILGINTSQVVFSPFAVRVLQGPPMPGPILSALQSQDLAGLVSVFVQRLAPLTITPPVLARQILFTQTVPKEFEKFGISQFEWFHVDIKATRIVVKIMEQAVTVAVDLAAFTYQHATPISSTTITRGDKNQLVDLTKVRGQGSIYTFTINQRVFENPPYEPFLVPGHEPAGGSIATVFNMDVIAFVVANQISPQVAGTPIAENVKLNSIGIAYSTFQKPLLPSGLAQQDGLAFNFSVATPLGNVEGRILLQMYCETFDLPTAFMRPDGWVMYAAQAEVNIPSWINIAIFGAGFITLLSPFAVFGVVAGISEISNIATLSEANAREKLKRLTIPVPLKKPLSGLTGPDWAWEIQYASFTSESADIAIYPVVELRLEEAPGIFSPLWWPVENRNPIPVTLKLRDDLEKLAGKNLMLNWEVRRADTNQLVASAVKAYTDPLGNGVFIPHHTPELYAVDSFIAHVTATITLGSLFDPDVVQVGEIWSGEQKIIISDKFDRHHKYVHWGPHVVFFMNEGTKEGTPPEQRWWSHVRRSRIHRTALSARCKMLRESKRNEDAPRQYFDALPFAFKELDQHRKPLCDYCFFGGPDKHVPFPEEDWF